MKDMCIIFPLAFFIARTGAYKRLTPHVPTGSLISFPIISSILLQTVIAFGFQFGSWYYLAQQSWYENTCTNEGATIGTCQDNTVIYLVSNMQYLITVFAFSVSKPFRKPLYTNVLLTLFMIIAFAYSVYIIVIPDRISRKILQIYDFRNVNNDNAKYFKLYLLGFTLGNFCVSYITESVLIPAMTKCYSTANCKIEKFSKK